MGLKVHRMVYLIDWGSLSKQIDTQGAVWLVDSQRYWIWKQITWQCIRPLELKSLLVACCLRYTLKRLGWRYSNPWRPSSRRNGSIFIQSCPKPLLCIEHVICWALIEDTTVIIICCCDEMRSVMPQIWPCFSIAFLVLWAIQPECSIQLMSYAINILNV